MQNLIKNCKVNFNKKKKISFKIITYIYYIKHTENNIIQNKYLRSKNLVRNKNLKEFQESNFN